MRYFRSQPSVYEDVRAALDAAWGHPNADTKTETCIQPAAQARLDANGMCVVSVSDDFCEYDAVASLLPSLLLSGAVEEITEAEYKAAFPQLPSMG